MKLTLLHTMMYCKLWFSNCWQYFTKIYSTSYFKFTYYVNLRFVHKCDLQSVYRHLPWKKENFSVSVFYLNGFQNFMRFTNRCRAYMRGNKTRLVILQIRNNYWMRFCDMQNYQYRWKSYQPSRRHWQFCISQKPYPIFIVLLYISSEKKTNNCFIIDLKPKIINMTRKTIKNRRRRLNMQITELSASQ